MFLAVDIGNTSIKFGLFDGDHIVSTHVIPTVRNATSADIAAAVDEWLTVAEAALISSVVPEIDPAMRDHLSRVVPSVSFVRTSDNFGLTHRFPIDDVGTDRLVNVSAAAAIYGVPCIVAAFGTATTIDAVTREREHLGGLIAPGPATTAKALGLAASKLPEVDITEPPGVIATNTVHAIQAGILYGQLGLVERVVPDMKQEIGPDARVIATGGFARLMAGRCRVIDVVDRDLTLKGLELLHRRTGVQPA